MENSDEILQILERFTRLKQKEIPKELEDYLQYVARTGDTMFKWSSLKYLFREKLLSVIKHFNEDSQRLEGMWNSFLNTLLYFKFLWFINILFLLTIYSWNPELSKCGSIQLWDHEVIAFGTSWSIQCGTFYRATPLWASHWSSQAIFTYW